MPRKSYNDAYSDSERMSDADSETVSDNESDPMSDSNSEDMSDDQSEILPVKKLKVKAPSKPRASADDEDYFDAKEAICESLELICKDSKASFSSQGSMGEDVNPGLYVEDVGSIGLPISEHDAQRLISCSRQAPFGKQTHG